MLVDGKDSAGNAYSILVDSSGRPYVVQHEKDRTVTNATAANHKIEIHQPASKETFEVIQDTAADLKATVTQASAARTVTGTVTANPTSFSTQLSSAITLTTANTAYLLPASEQAARITLVIYNSSDTTVYIGGSGVTTAAGMPLASSKYMVIPASANVYAVCGSASKTLRLMECK